MTTALYDPAMTVDEAAAYLRCRPNHVRNLIRAGEIRAMGGGRGRAWITTRTALNEYMQREMGVA